MMTMTNEQLKQQEREQAIGQRTQQILAERIGNLFIGNARLQAEAEWTKAAAEHTAAEATKAAEE